MIKSLLNKPHLKIISGAAAALPVSVSLDRVTSSCGPIFREGPAEVLSPPLPRRKLPEWWTDDLPRELSVDEIVRLSEEWQARVRRRRSLGSSRLKSQVYGRPALKLVVENP